MIRELINAGHYSGVVPTFFQAKVDLLTLNDILII
jgi:hypothetical protein